MRNRVVKGIPWKISPSVERSGKGSGNARQGLCGVWSWPDREGAGSRSATTPTESGDPVRFAPIET